MKQYKNIMAQLPGNAEDMGTCGGIQSTGFLFPTMKPTSPMAEMPKAEAAQAEEEAEKGIKAHARKRFFRLPVARLCKPEPSHLNSGMGGTLRGNHYQQTNPLCTHIRKLASSGSYRREQGSSSVTVSSF